jgi:hypothetical protein
MRDCMRLLETWVKAPFLRDASLLLISECAQAVFTDLCNEFMKDHVVLTSCPTAENPGLIMGKLASILACSPPREITLLTVDGSPHCFTLHAALNQAKFLTRSDIPCRHYVVIDGKAVEVSPESVRVGRYLHLVQECIQACPEILDRLTRYSLEQEDSERKGKRC